ncbi:menaquinone biosynthetic enzyme MqnA/MqnD family protein [Lewinella cohaerens]|uniref:menaquinone biosynthetic enzyme MqnA/MqnD family protein n=1 Tax=Lewinella cohaerens TaxID=70995 RepID=UPI0003656D20|nr:menaquinone biosynthesis protein [Lewinella cohaerens]
MRKIKITAVSYLNTKPLLYGILNSPLADQVDLSLDIPSECARKLREGEVDLALTPVAILPELKNWHLVSDYCIGAVGEVKTVNIYSEVPIEEITALYLDHHSRSSVALSRVLLRDHWRITPKLLEAKEGYINQIKGSIAGVVIGDRTIGLERSFPYVYDLSLAWQSLTDLPFVFAAWVSTKSLPEAFKLAFNEALKAGIAAIPKLKLLLPSPDPSFDLETYFTSYISYNLDEAKREALHKFLGYVAALEPFHPQISRSSQPV